MAESARTDEPRTSGEHTEGEAWGSESEHLREQARQVRDDARDLGQDLSAAGDEVVYRLREQLVQRPYGTLAAAAGVGYLLGGGVPKPVTKFLFGVGARVATGLLATHIVSTLSQEGVEGVLPSEGSPET